MNTQCTTMDHLDEEKNQQKYLKEVRNSYKQAEVLSKKVVKCKLVNWEGSFGVSNTQYMMSIGSHRFPARFEYKDDLIDSIEFNSTPLYATVYEIQYKNIKRTIVLQYIILKKKLLKN